jgi:hypothetical protein
VSVIRRTAMVCVLALGTALAIAAPSWGWGYKVTTIASGLDNPRGLAFGPDGALYVAEAGHGGEECFKHPGHGPVEEESCVGFTSGASRITSAGVKKVAGGWFSTAEKGGFGAEGIESVTFAGSRPFGIEGNNDQALPPVAPKGLSEESLAKAKQQVGHLIEFNSSGQGHTVLDVGKFDWNWTKEHKELVPQQFPDANPYSIIPTRWGLLLVDAAANTLELISPNGHITVEAFIPNPPFPKGAPEADAVPTCLDIGPDGAVYISQLTGASAAPGAASVWRFTPGHLTKWATGLTAVTGCGFGPDGQFYAVEFSTKGLVAGEPGTGAVVKVPPHSSTPIPIAENLSFPGGFARGSNAIYFSNWSIAPAVPAGPGAPTGQVDRITKNP